MKRSAASLVVLSLLACACATEADGAVMYSNDFETGPLGPEWSTNSVLSSASPFTRFNGRYASGYTILNLAQPVPPGNGYTNPPGGGSYNDYHLTFDFYAIDSWDGNTAVNADLIPVGPDWFDVSVNNTTMMHETFSNVVGRTQTFHAPTVGPALMGYNTAFYDSIYRSVAIDFSLPTDQGIQINWHDLGMQAMTDESWGIDNVHLSYTTVPAPGSLGVMAGALVLGRRRRR